MNFYTVTSLYKEMKLLEHIEHNDKTTQKEISKIIGSSLAMVNNYINKFEEQNYLEREYKSSRTVIYHITDLGQKRKKYLQITYIKELMDQYVEGQTSARQFLQSIEDKNFHKILLYGAGEVAEIILDIIQTNNINLEVVGIIDDDIKKQGQNLRDYPICSNHEISQVEHDAIVITSYLFEDAILKRLQKVNYNENKIVRYFNIGDN